MKIIQVTTFFHPVVGGIETHVANLSKKLIASDHEVTVLTSNSGKSNPRIKKYFDKLGDIPIIRFRNIFNLSYLHKVFPGIFFYLMKNDFDIIHVHGFRKPETYFAMLAAKLKKKKIVLTTHNPFPASTKSQKMEFFSTIHDKTFGKWFTKYFDKIIFVANSEKQIFKNKFNVAPDTLVKIGNGIELEYFNKGDISKFIKAWDIDADKYESIVSMAGRINFSKGYQHLAKAIADNPKVLFFIAGGDDGYLKYLKQQFESFENVIFTERFLPREKLIDMYTASDLFLFPSTNEPLGIVLLEALANGTPIVCSDQGGAKEFLTNSIVRFVPPTDQEDWSLAIQELLKDKDRLQQMSKKGIIEAQKYTWDKISKKIINLYSKLS